MSKETVTITKEEYDDLVESYQWLCALESAGVDNWCGYDHAKEILKEWDEEEWNERVNFKDWTVGWRS